MAKAPPALGKKIDQFFKFHNERLKLEKQAAKVKDKEKKIRDDLIIAMGKAKVDSAKSPSGSISISRPEVGRVSDWPALYKWIKKTNTFEVLQQRLSQGNYAEQLEHSPALAKKGIPGIDKVTVVKFTPTAKRG